MINDILLNAFDDYLGIYFRIVQKANKIEDQRSEIILEGQKAYMHYRATKDPARNMLQGYFGREWTESYINSVLFDLE